MSGADTPSRENIPTKAIIKSVDSELLTGFPLDCPVPVQGCFVALMLSTCAEHPTLTSVSEDMQQQVVELAVSALERYNVEKDVAMWLKKEADRIWGTTWHCVVGKK
jgi:hypothetical protein